MVSVVTEDEARGRHTKMGSFAGDGMRRASRGVVY